MALNCSNSGQSQPFCGDHWRSRGLPDQSERHELFRLIIGRSLFEDLLICMWLSPLFPIWINLFFEQNSTGLHTISAHGGVMDVRYTRIEYCWSPRLCRFVRYVDSVESRRFGGETLFLLVISGGQQNHMGKYCLHFHHAGQCIELRSASGLQICTKRKWCHIKDWQTLADVLSHVTWLWPCVAGADCVFMGNAIYELLGKRKRASWCFMCCQATLRRFKKCRMKA